MYILASRKNGTLYVGMTEDIGKRIVRHKNGNGCKFTKDYEVNKLVYLEKCENRQTAMTREKQLKKYNRRWKIRAIEQLNPKWEDLSGETITANNPGSPAEDQGSFGSPPKTCGDLRFATRGPSLRYGRGDEE